MQTVKTITWFHRLLAMVWICGLIGLGLGIATSSASTDRYIRSEVGLLRKPMTEATRWVLDKQIKSIFGGLDTNAQFAVHDGIRFVWEIAWQQLVLKALVSLVSALFKIIQQYLNKLLDMITSIGNVGAILTPLTSTVVSAINTAFARTEACAQYKAKQLAGSITGQSTTDSDECTWLSENDTNETALSIDEQIARKKGKIAVVAASGSVPQAKIDSLVKDIVKVQKEEQSVSESVKNDCVASSGDALLDALVPPVEGNCAALDYYQMYEELMMNEEESSTRTEISNTVSTAQKKQKDTLEKAGVGNGKLLAMISKGDLTGNEDLKMSFSKLPIEYKPKSDSDTLSFITLDALNTTAESFAIARDAANQSNTGGSAGDGWDSISDTFSKLLEEMLDNLIKNGILALFKIITDKVMGAINSFLGDNSIIGSLGGDIIGGAVQSTFAELSKSITGIDKKIEDTDGKQKKGEVAEVDCSKSYWVGDDNYGRAISKEGCTVVSIPFQTTWCATLNPTQYQGVIDTVNSATSMNNPNNVINLIKNSCVKRGAGTFESSQR